MALVIGGVFVILTGFSAGMIAARQWGHQATDIPTAFWGALGISSFLISVVWLLLVVCEVRAMDWR